MAEYQFDYSVDEVFEKMTDPDFLVARSTSLGEKNLKMNVEESGRKTVVTMNRTVKRDLPKMLAKLFGDENSLIITDTWEEVGSTKMGTSAIEIPGQPVTVSAKFKLKPSDAGCEYSIDYKCKAKIPMVGKKVEQFIMAQTEEGMVEEMDYLVKVLKEAEAA